MVGGVIKKLVELAYWFDVEWEIRESMYLEKGERIIKAIKEGPHGGVALGLISKEKWPDYKQELIKKIEPYVGQFNMIIYRTSTKGGRSRLYLIQKRWHDLRERFIRLGWSNGAFWIYDREKKKYISVTYEPTDEEILEKVEYAEKGGIFEAEWCVGDEPPEEIREKLEEILYDES